MANQVPTFPDPLHAPFEHRMGIAHIGLPKTASTFLQRNVFPRLPIRHFSSDVRAEFPAEYHFVYEVNRAWTSDLYTKIDINHRSRREETFACAVNSLTELFEKKKSKISNANQGPWLVSSEGFSGFSLQCAAANFQYLHAIGIRRIILVIRRQTDWLPSFWIQTIFREDRFSRFIPFYPFFYGSRTHQMVDCDWNALATLAEARFGHESVFVVPYEKLRINPNAFIKDLLRFIFVGHEINEDFDLSWVKHPDAPLQYYAPLSDRLPVFRKHVRLRLLSRIIIKRFRNHMNSSLVRGHDGTIDEYHLRVLWDEMRQSNESLSRRLGLDLEEYGYF